MLGIPYLTSLEAPQYGCGPNCPLVVRPKWCWEVAEGLRDFWRLGVHQDGWGVVGRVYRPTPGYLRRLPTGSGEEFQHSFAHSRSIPVESPSQRQLYRVICDCLCTDMSESSGSDVSSTDGGECESIIEEDNVYRRIFDDWRTDDIEGW